MVGWVFFRSRHPARRGRVPESDGGPAGRRADTVHVQWYLTPELWLALVAGAIGSAPSCRCSGSGAIGRSGTALQALASGLLAASAALSAACSSPRSCRSRRAPTTRSSISASDGHASQRRPGLVICRPVVSGDVRSPAQPRRRRRRRPGRGKPASSRGFPRLDGTLAARSPAIRQRARPLVRGSLRFRARSRALVRRIQLFWLGVSPSASVAARHAIGWLFYADDWRRWTTTRTTDRCQTSTSRELAGVDRAARATGCASEASRTCSRSRRTSTSSIPRVSGVGPPLEPTSRMDQLYTARSPTPACRGGHAAGAHRGQGARAPLLPDRHALERSRGVRGVSADHRRRPTRSCRRSRRRGRDRISTPSRGTSRAGISPA